MPSFVISSGKKNDGFYFSPRTTVENVQLAANLASRATGLPPFELKCQNLEAEWHRRFSILERIQTINRPEKKRKSDENQVKGSSNSDPQAQAEKHLKLRLQRQSS